LLPLSKIEEIRQSTNENPDGLSEANAAAIASASQSKIYGSLSPVLLLLFLILLKMMNQYLSFSKLEEIRRSTTEDPDGLSEADATATLASACN
jgi:hypothetical protein